MVSEDRLKTYLAYQQYQLGKNEAWRRMSRMLTFSGALASEWSFEGAVTEVDQARLVQSVWHDEFLYQVLEKEAYQAYRLEGNVLWRDNRQENINGMFVIEGNVNLSEISNSAGVRRLDILVRRGGRLTHDRYVTSNAYEYLNVYLEEDAYYEQRAALGSNTGYRLAQRILLLGKNSQAKICEGIVGHSAKVSDHVLIEHCAPDTKSEHIVRSLVRSAVDVYSTVNVKNQGKGSISKQDIHHLLLADNARIFSKPALNIAIDEVDCQHGAVSSMLDEHAMFYMSSRGIPYERAKALYIKGYIEDLYHKEIGLCQYLHQLLDSQYE